jgi:eukaryotic-like serine/threonine-protein kinase
MALAIGQHLGSYEITALLGKGGMGEVYRARDVKLKREVAVKILPDEFNRNSDRMSRFQREAEVLASLNHPNIAAIYHVEEAGDTRLLVLELVEGETLTDRIQRGPIPVEETLDIARHIAEAVEAAHEKGIVHRDLKPANVKVTPDGKVKVLDFGLAKSWDAPPDNQNLSNSPTLSMAATNAGVILGTAAYMSPEQAKGAQADWRSDVFSFGCVLYEMLTGRQVFRGESVSEVLAAVLIREADLTSLPPNLNPRLPELLRRCLEKNPKRRWQAVGDLRLELETLSAAPYVGPVSVEAAGATPSKRPVFWIAATVAVLLLAVGMGVAFTLLYRSLEEPRVVRFFVGPPEKSSFGSGSGAGGEVTLPIISPDGRRLAFTARDTASGNKILLWVRTLDTLKPQSLPETDGAYLPFWSPDSRSIAFFAQGMLKRIDIAGGPPQNLAEAPGARGGAWSRDNVIVFAPISTGPLYRVSVSGGERVAITKLTQGQTSHRSPSFLPDGRHFLYLVTEGGQVNEVFVGSLGSEESKRILAANAGAVYSRTGELLFTRQGTLFRQRFDTTKLDVSGDPVPVAESIGFLNNVGFFSVSNNGVLAYRTGTGLDDVVLTWVDRSGRILETVGTPGVYRGVDVSPDGQRIAVHRHDGNGGDIWVYEHSRAPQKQTFDPERDNSSPVWSPDGSRIAFGAVRNGKWSVYQKLANGTGSEELLFESDSNAAPMSWSHDGKFIVLRVVSIEKTQGDEWLLSVNDKKAAPLIHEIPNELRGQISPDGKWIAYESDATGQSEIYVKPFPSGEGKVQISTNGGISPRWRGDGKELFYMTSTGSKVVSVKTNTTGPAFDYKPPTELFDSGYVVLNHAGGSFNHYAVSPDGSKFLILRPATATAGDAATTPITLILDWFSSVKR